MKTANRALRPTERSIASYVKRNAPRVKHTLRHGHAVMPSVREDQYKGHHIKVRTTYDIRVDGVPVTGHLGVTNDGRVHYHPVPNVSFASAIDLVKQLIDLFPDDFFGDHQGGAGHRHAAIRRSRPRSGKKSKSRT
jgi:hypothetical protein